MPKKKLPEEQYYNLTISETQAHTICAACELLSRIHMGQLDHITNILVHLEMDRFCELRDELRRLEPLATGLPPNSYHGIHSQETPEEARIAWDINQVLRHRVSHDRADREGVPSTFTHRMTVNYDTPLRSSEECQLAKINQTTKPEPDPREIFTIETRKQYKNRKPKTKPQAKDKTAN